MDAGHRPRARSRKTALHVRVRGPMGRRRCACSSSPLIAYIAPGSPCVISLQQDTFVVGCRYSDKIVYPETFAGNPDAHDAVFSSEYGIYQPGCGLDNVMLSWGHDEVSTHPFLLSDFLLTDESYAVSLPRPQGPEHLAGRGSRDDPLPQLLSVSTFLYLLRLRCMRRAT